MKSFGVHVSRTAAPTRDVVAVTHAMLAGRFCEELGSKGVFFGCCCMRVRVRVSVCACGRVRVRVRASESLRMRERSRACVRVVFAGGARRATSPMADAAMRIVTSTMPSIMKLRPVWSSSGMGDHGGGGTGGGGEGGGGMGGGDGGGGEGAARVT